MDLIINIDVPIEVQIYIPRCSHVLMFLHYIWGKKKKIHIDKKK